MGDTGKVSRQSLTCLCLIIIDQDQIFWFCHLQFISPEDGKALHSPPFQVPYVLSSLKYVLREKFLSGVHRRDQC